MRLEDIESGLPNGLHDAKINAICRSLTGELVEVHLDVLVGTPDDEPHLRDEMRSGILRFKKANVVIIEQPDVESPFHLSGSVGFVLTEDEPGSVSGDILQKLGEGHHTYTFFVQEWFSNLKIVAMDLEFAWS